MRTFFYLLIIALFIAGCKKGKADFTITGTLSDNTFGTKLNGATVSLYEVEAGTTNSSLIGTATVSSSGIYSFTFPRNQAESYTLVAEKNNYFPIEETIYFSSLTIEEDNVRNFGTTAKGWMKLRFVNIAPNAPTDVLRYLKQAGKSGCSECHTTEERFLNGLIDTTIYCVNDGNTPFSYLYNVLGTSDAGLKSAQSIAFDTTEILLEY